MPKVRWNGRHTRIEKGTIIDLKEFIPTFRKEKFTYNSNTNEYLDTIVVNKSKYYDEKPVATVSKKYALLQHKDVIEAVEETLNKIDATLNQQEHSLIISEFGEKMWLSLNIGETFDPGDGHPISLHLDAINSVDKTSSLIIKSTWKRLICANGMIRKSAKNFNRRRHLGTIDTKELTEYIKESMESAKEEKEKYAKWHNKPLKLRINRKILQDWIDSTVSEKWGTHLAARIYNILNTARDGKPERITDPEKRKFPHRIHVTQERIVPGQKPAQTMYDVANALTYISSHHNSIGSRNKMMTEVPSLLRELEKEIK